MLVIKMPDKKVNWILGLFLRESDQEKREDLGHTMYNRLVDLYENKVKATAPGWSYYVCILSLANLFKGANKPSDRIWVACRFWKCYARMLQYI